MNKLGIPKNLFHIWIGDRDAPTEWMLSWRKFHPEWNYRLIDNDYIKTNQFINQHLIDEYIKRSEYAGAADLIRYEVLFRHGGFIPEADSICLKNTDDLWRESAAYTVYENEVARPGFVSPILASQAGNEFLSEIIFDLNRLKYYQIGKAWRTTGNEYLSRKIKESRFKVEVFPSQYFIPNHFSEVGGPDKNGIYAVQLFAETTNSYKPLPFWRKMARLKGRMRSAFFRKILNHVV
jgi:mannosyltransferase OCH1-like enzyme